MRPREQAFDINTYYKYKVVTDLKTVKSEEKEQQKENYKNLIDFVGANLTKKEIQSNIKITPITFPPPDYQNISKKYINTKEKPIKFHEKARISNGLDVGDIAEKQVQIDFTTLMAMFDNDDEINEVDREKLLGIDLEQMGSLKDKAERLIEYLNSFSDDNDKEKDNAIQKLEKKIESLKEIEDDIENIISNITKVDKIIFGTEETKVLFNLENK